MFYVTTVGYYALNVNEIIEKYCVNKDIPELQCNGQCHLAKQLKISTTTEETQNISFVSDIVFTILYYQAIDIPHFTSPFYNNVIPTTKQYTYSYLHSKNVFHPPLV